MTTIPIVVFTFLATATLMCLLFAFVDRRAVKMVAHKHDWTGWSEWIEGVEEPDLVVWLRLRACRTCGESEDHRVGRHRCASARSEKGRCDHRDLMAALFDDRTTALERDLGMLGDGR